ncbi:MAG: hypothetical protein Q4D74_07450 [Comamonadaceae bacterium]|nr:hypothetical protein [Comamonadaceae bacterium]
MAWRLAKNLFERARPQSCGHPYPAATSKTEHHKQAKKSANPFQKIAPKQSPQNQSPPKTITFQQGKFKSEEKSKALSFSHNHDKILKFLLNPSAPDVIKITKRNMFQLFQIYIHNGR